MIDWNKDIHAYVARTATSFSPSLPLHDVDDLIQEGWLVFDRLKKSHGETELRAHHNGELRNPAAAWMGLFRKSLRNRYLTMIRLGAADRGDRRAAQRLEDNPSAAGSAVVRRAPDCFRAVEIACDLERAPGIRRILETANYENCARIRTAKTRADGTQETRQDVLQRLAGRRTVGDYAAQLALVV